MGNSVLLGIGCGVAAMDVPTRGANAESVILTENGEVEAGNAV
jgi:hypothetical protein